MFKKWSFWGGVLFFAVIIGMPIFLVMSSGGAILPESKETAEERIPWPNTVVNFPDGAQMYEYVLRERDSGLYPLGDFFYGDTATVSVDTDNQFVEEFGGETYIYVFGFIHLENSEADGYRSGWVKLSDASP